MIARHAKSFRLWNHLRIGIDKVLTSRSFATTQVADLTVMSKRQPPLDNEESTPHEYKIVPLKHWYADTTDKDPFQRFPILDIRTPQQFQENHIATAINSNSNSNNNNNNSSRPRSDIVVVPLEMRLLRERSFELPARHVEFVILCHEEEQLQKVWDFMGPTPSKTRRMAQRPWQIRCAVLGSDPTNWEEAQELGIHAGELPLQVEEKQEELNQYHLLPRLWQPDRMIQDVLTPLLCEQVVGASAEDPSSRAPQLLQVWDLGSGAGRDVAFVAEELLLATRNKMAQPCFSVMAVDHRYNDKETDITSRFLERRGVNHVTNVVKLDISEWKNVETAILQHNHDDDDNKEIGAVSSGVTLALYCVRFWKRSMVDALVHSSALPAGTLFGLSHFCKAQPGAKWDFDHPSEKTVLERDELATLFANAGRVNGNCGHKWEILHDEIALDTDHGRTMVHFVARKML
jgi:rhodanese-related sulfurtransferase